MICRFTKQKEASKQTNKQHNVPLYTKDIIAFLTLHISREKIQTLELSYFENTDSHTTPR